MKGAGFVNVTVHKVKKVVKSLKESALVAGQRVRRKCKRSFPAHEVCVFVLHTVHGEVGLMNLCFGIFIKNRIINV